MKALEKDNGSAAAAGEPMDRRKFCTRCVTCVSGAMLLAHPGLFSEAVGAIAGDDKAGSQLSKKEIRKLFMKKGSCSHLFFYILNHEYGHNKMFEERAIDQLAGGIAESGYQCGMLWGTSMGAAAEAYRMHENKGQAIAGAVATTRLVIDEFVTLTKSTDCLEITSIDLAKRFSNLKMIFSAGDCFNLAYQWYPKAIKTAAKGLSQNYAAASNITTCASEVVSRLGGSEEEMVLVSGFAGGLGLSGNGCGALSAAIWKRTLDWCRDNPEKERGYSYDEVQDLAARFEEATQGELLCHKLTGKQFNTVEEHSEYIQSGGCQEIIDILIGE